MLDLKFQPNELDKYSQYTYFFTLFMKGCNGKKVVLAETSGTTNTGMSSFSIESVDIKSVHSTSTSTLTGMGTNFSFEIKEPRGASFFDKLIIEASRLGVPNFTKVDYFLELKFLCRDEFGLPRPVSGLGRGTTLTYPITIIKCKTDITAGGTTYSFTAVRRDDVGYSDQYCKLRRVVNVTQDTFGEFIKDLETGINVHEKEELGEKVEIADEYKIEVVKLPDAPDIGSFKLRSPHDANFQPSRNSAYVKDKNGKPVLQVGAGTLITVCIDEILSNTKELKESFAKTNNGKYIANTKEDDFIKWFYRIVTTVETLDFDEKRNDYAKKITYKIIPYKVVSLITKLDELKEGKEINKSRLKKVNSDMLLKRYDYIYTGLNDQVIDFDMSLNFAWYMDIPKNDGAYTTGTSDAGRNVSESTTNPEVRKQRQKSASKGKIKANIPCPSNDKDVRSGTEAKPKSLSSSMVSTTTKNDNTSKNVGSEMTTDEGTNIIGTYFSQLMRGNSELVNIELEVKGDAHWLPASLDEYGVDKQLTDKTNKQNNKDVDSQDTSNYAEPVLNENLILFVIKTPSVVGDNITSLPKSGVFSGIYGIRKVDHSFSNGKFVQKLYAFRIHTIDITQLLDIL